MEKEKLFCKGGGCTAKLGAGILSRILSKLPQGPEDENLLDRKSTRLNSSHP